MTFLLVLDQTRQPLAQAGHGWNRFSDYQGSASSQARQKLLKKRVEKGEFWSFLAIFACFWPCFRPQNLIVGVLDTLFSIISSMIFAKSAEFGLKIAILRFFSCNIYAELISYRFSYVLLKITLCIFSKTGQKSWKKWNFVFWHRKITILAWKFTPFWPKIRPQNILLRKLQSGSYPGARDERDKTKQD